MSCSQKCFGSIFLFFLLCYQLQAAHSRVAHEALGDFKRACQEEDSDCILRLAKGVALLTYHAGARTGEIRFLKQAQEGRADPNERFNGRTPLSKAAEFGFIEAMTFLIAVGADVNATNAREDGMDCDGNTPLHLAALRNQVESIRFLLEHGALINNTNKQGMTPIMLAAHSGGFEAVEALLQADAELDQQCETGHTAIQLAQKNDHASIVASLRDYDAPDSSSPGAQRVSPYIKHRSRFGSLPPLDLGEGADVVGELKTFDAGAEVGLYSVPGTPETPASSISTKSFRTTRSRGGPSELDTPQGSAFFGNMNKE